MPRPPDRPPVTIHFPMSPIDVNGSILGAAVKRTEDPRLIRGEGTYVDDLHFDDEVWMVLVRSPLAHGTIVSIDTTPATDMPGVVGVFTAADFDAVMPTDFAGQPELTRSPLLSGEKVHFVGDPVAVVVAASQAEAIDAAETVWVEIDPLPAIPTVAAALAPDAPLLFPGLGSNVIHSGGGPRHLDSLDDAEVVVRLEIENQRVAAVPLETNNAVAIPSGDEVEVWLGSQSVHAARNAISTALGIDRSRIRVRVPDMGGGFGAKIFTYREQVLCVALALRLQRPVRWIERRTESLVSMNHGRGQHHVIELGARADGTITGARISVIQDGGGRPLFGAQLPEFTNRMAAGPYRIPKLDFSWRSVLTTTTPIHAYRGAGRPEATVTLERALDVLAARLGLDPVEIRKRNFLDPAAFPQKTVTGERYDTGDYAAALDLALSKIDYPGLRQERQSRRQRGDRLQLGIGIAAYVEVTAPASRKDWGAVEIHDDGSATVYSGALSHGHGHETTMIQIASGLLHIPGERISFVQGDTDRVTRGGGTMGSRSLQMAGSAVLRSANTLRERARQLVADDLEASVADIAFDDQGRLGVAGVPDTARTWAEIAGLAGAAGIELRTDDVYLQEHSTVAFGTHISVVEVDTETGETRLLRHVACDDAGNILNRVVLDGQVHGGIAQGIGQALFEQVLYDTEANPLTTNLTSYLLPTASSLPFFTIDHTVTPTGENPLGVKGIGEAGTVGATPAVYNAVLDAIRHLGVDHLDMPLTAARVWAAIRPDS